MVNRDINCLCMIPYDAKIVSVRFRCKRNSWKKYDMEIQFAKYEQTT